MIKKIGLVLFAIFVIIQFFRIDKTNPEVIAENDFINIVNPPEEVAAIIKASCYDCHSSTTTYPWYSNVAPISWWLKDHINEAREELNFSEWATFTDKRKTKKFKEAVEELEEEEMPLPSYTWLHGKAKLSKEQRQELINWFKSQQVTEETSNQEEETALDLKLNKGSKWIANPETIEAINNMKAILANPVEEERVILYVSNGQKLMLEFEQMVQKCNMTGDAHDQLHHYIFPLKEKIELLMNCEETTSCDLTQLDILRHLHLFSEYFEGESLPS